MLWFRLLIGLAVVLALSPVFSVIIASMIASAYGCTLHEGFANPCIIGGQDWGETLYAMAVIGWLALATLPIAALMVVIWLVVEIFMFRRRRSGASTTASPPD
jgi:hypothetical protein